MKLMKHPTLQSESVWHRSHQNSAFVTSKQKENAEERRKRRLNNPNFYQSGDKHGYKHSFFSTAFLAPRLVRGLCRTFGRRLRCRQIGLVGLAELLGLLDLRLAGLQLPSALRRYERKHMTTSYTLRVVIICHLIIVSSSSFHVLNFRDIFSE